MVDTFTLHALIRYAYRESCETETLQIRELESVDLEVAEEIKGIRDAKNLLPKATFSPHRQTLENILEHSRRTA